MFRTIARIWTGVRIRKQLPFLRNIAALDAHRPVKEKVDKKEFFSFVARDGRRSVADVNKEFARLSFGPGKITLEDYVRYRFYDPDGPTFEEKQRFISDTLHWKMVAKVSDPIYDALTQDKFISYRLLESFGFPVPTTLAAITTGVRSFPQVHTIRSADELQQYVSKADRRLFMKTNTGMGSFAAFICDGVEGDVLLTRPHGRKTAAEIMAIIEGHDFLVQEMLVNHADLAPVTDAVSTIRMTNFLVNGNVHTPVALMKLAAEEAVADNFWRAGNMLADIDPETGRFRRVVRGHGMKMELLEKAPKSGHPLIGFQVPFWREIVDLNRKCALTLAPMIPFTSLDIAVTDSGPVIVEVNTGGSFDLPQLASGRGLMTAEIKSFFGL